ncbi:hypothetical protein [Phormidium sp. CCY1219]|uniref:hypothetical protein n=1 Tax=Phormidium sp. CCY1219 TaxID=2886104 RepID=UPI002D1EB1F3|nr:hypothetical protein [Phormidium sp. CCY1219]MEB3830733.1 hypothetical protein [Phormidium sp. CCY1219]
MKNFVFARFADSIAEVSNSENLRFIFSAMLVWTREYSGYYSVGDRIREHPFF